jgi:tetratricopeptide (TPR) repeat protein
MELTLEQTLQQGVTAHKTGDLKRAESLYRAILQSHPEHPDANHNLGVLGVSLNQIEVALPLFKTALKANPKIEQFWISYIDALVKTNQSKVAKEAIIIAKKKGLDDRKLKALLLKSKSKIDTKLPPQEKLNDLLEHYKNGRFHETEKLALSITQEFPKHQFSWKVMGALFGQSGRTYEALDANNIAVELSPKDAEAHSNLGNTLIELDRLDEAETSYRQAIALKPDYVEAYCNLGNTLKKLWKLDESEALYRQAIELKPEYNRAHYNLGIMLKEQGRMEDAIHHFDLACSAEAVSQSLECLYMIKNYSEFNKRIDSISEFDDKNIRLAAVSAFVAHQNRRHDPYPFCTNPLDFIVNKNLAEYILDSDTLVEEIIKEADELELVWESRTTKFGFQGSNNFFEKPCKNTAYLETIVLKAVNEYYDKFKYESNSFIKKWPKNYRLKGWYNRLLKNGYQTAHIHPDGWLSGVIYLKTIDSLNDEEGAIEFGLHGYDLPIIDENHPRKLYSPKRGDIILFPSSLFHRTIPFTQDTERCVIAFDLKPT